MVADAKGKGKGKGEGKGKGKGKGYPKGMNAFPPHEVDKVKGRARDATARRVRRVDAMKVRVVRWKRGDSNRRVLV